MIIPIQAVSSLADKRREFMNLLSVASEMLQAEKGKTDEYKAHLKKMNALKKELRVLEKAAKIKRK
jgi:cell shape-determining protein MreC